MNLNPLKTELRPFGSIVHFHGPPYLCLCFMFHVTLSVSLATLSLMQDTEHVYIPF